MKATWATLALSGALLALAAAGGSAAAERGLGSIVFVRGEGSGPPGLYAIDADGSHLRRLAAEFAERPAWSPDGRRIVYETNYRDAHGLHVLSLGGRPRLLAPRGSDGHDCAAKGCSYDDPVWSPDGKYVACTYHTETETGHESGLIYEAIALVPAAGGATVFLTKRVANREPAWSPGSRYLAFTAADGIRRVGANGGPSRLLAKGDGLYHPAWSRKGRIAFAGRNRIEVVNADGSGRRVVARIAGARRAFWSPSGELLVVETVKPSGAPGALYLVGADGSKLHRLTRAGVQPAWSPDGRFIAYVAGGLFEQGGLYVVAVDGTKRRQLTNSGSDAEPAWQPAPSRR